jgi:hypothetical protein
MTEHRGMSIDAEPAQHDTAEERAGYPESAPADEQRRAYVLDTIGAAASEMDTQTLCQMVIDLAEMLRTGLPPAARKLRPVR